MSDSPLLTSESRFFQISTKAYKSDCWEDFDRSHAVYTDASRPGGPPDLWNEETNGGDSRRAPYPLTEPRRGDVILVVAVYRTHRRSWPDMTEQVGALLGEYPGPIAHDSTGIGSAIREYPALAGYYQLEDVTMVGRARIDLFRNYIGAVERHEIVCPRIDALYTEHKYCGEDDLYGSGHSPDTVVALLGAV